jgi:acetylornithine/N-succinyldiaminopimelate aminotransferase
LPSTGNISAILKILECRFTNFTATFCRYPVSASSFLISRMNLRELFLRHVAQTSTAPLALEIVHAEGSLLTGASGKKYIDLIGGISVANTGHRHPAVVAAIQQQLDKYLHIMVYGEMVQSPQVLYAKALAESLPEGLDSVYFTNSGAEAVEGAMKLAKKATGRHQVIAFTNSYHGSTQGALSIIGDEYWRNAYRPLLPGISHEAYNSYEVLGRITTETACLIMETVQAEAGIIVPDPEWVRAVSEKCKSTGTLLVLDEIQAGFGRTGRLWAFSAFGIVPDILLLGKALGGGLPLGAFISRRELMAQLSENPVLGHITTFGGHPLCCSAGLAAFEALINENMMEDQERKAGIFLGRLKHPMIRAVRSCGMWMAVEFDSFETCKKVIDNCIENGVLTDWFLFAPNCLRISPPLNIPVELVEKACRVILEAIESLGNQESRSYPT